MAHLLHSIQAVSDRLPRVYVILLLDGLAWLGIMLVVLAFILGTA